MKNYKNSLTLFVVLLLVTIIIPCRSIEATLISHSHIMGPINNMKIMMISDTTEYLFTSSETEIYLINPKTFEVEHSISIGGKIRDFYVIENIEDDHSPNKDLVILNDSPDLPSVMVYSLDTFKQLWTFTAFTKAYNDESIQIDLKLPIFDYDILGDEILFVAGYDLYKLNIKTGVEVWHYSYSNNIWSASFINDINSDGSNEIAISVQPTDIIGLNGINGKVLWQTKVAKPYQVKQQNKILGAVKRNVWDLQFINSQLMAVGEDGLIYQLNQNTGKIEKEKEILSEFPNIIAYQLYVEENKAKEYSELGSKDISSYQIIHAQEITDINNDSKNDILVTCFEPNQYANFQNLTPSIYVLDGATLDILWQKEFTGKQLINLQVSKTNASFFDGRKIEVLDLENGSTKEINKTIDNNMTNVYSLFYSGHLILNLSKIEELDITEPQTPNTLHTLSFFDGYDTIIKSKFIYKFYYELTPDNNNIKNYMAIECMDVTGAIVWSYDLENDYFNHYVIQEDNRIYLINQVNNIITLTYDNEVKVDYTTLQDASYPDGQDSIKYEKVNVFTTCTDFNSDGVLDLLVVLNNGMFYILNSVNLDEVILHKNLNDLITSKEQYYNYAFPVYTTSKRELFLVSNNQVTLVSFDQDLNPTVENSFSLNKFNFWDDGQNIKNNIDFDHDGYNDFVIRVGADQDNRALILYSSGDVGTIVTGWDFTLYPTQYLIDPNHYAITVTTSITDSEGNNQNVAKIVNPYTDFNEKEMILFNKIFYEGNDFTYNSQYKPLQIINKPDGTIDVAILMDHWGDSYIQIYNIDDDRNIIDVIPISARLTTLDEMKSLKIGAPGGYIDTFSNDNQNFLILTLMNQDQKSSYTTNIYQMKEFTQLRNVASVKGRLTSYVVDDQTMIYKKMNLTKKNVPNYTLNFINLKPLTQITNLKTNKVYKSSNLIVEWDAVAHTILYHVYVDDRLVEVTKDLHASLFLNNGENDISIGAISDDGTEVLSHYTIKINDKTEKPYYYLGYMVIALSAIIVLPLKFNKYKQRGQ